MLAIVLTHLLNMSRGLCMILGAGLFYTYVCSITVSERSLKVWVEAARKLDDWLERRGPRPTPAELELAAQLYMRHDLFDFRREDCHPDGEGYLRVPRELWPYMKSERELKRRYRNPC